MSYTPGPLPKETPPYIVRELHAIGEGLEQPRQVMAFSPTAVEPAKPRNGMTVYAVAPWNPGSGYGPYFYDASAPGWRPMFSTATASTSDAEEDGAWDPDSMLGGWTLDIGSFNKSALGATGPSIRGISALPGRAFGKRYLEFTFDAGTTFGTAVRHDVGITRTRLQTATAGAGGSLCDTGAGYRMGGAINVETTITSAPALVATLDVVSLAVDLSTGNVWLAKNGTWVSGDPATGVSPSGVIPVGGLYYPCASCESGAALGTTLRVVESEFDYPIPDGFKSWGSY